MFQKQFMNNDAVDKLIFLMKLNGKHIDFATLQIILCQFWNSESLFCILK